MLWPPLNIFYCYSLYTYACTGGYRCAMRNCIANSFAEHDGIMTAILAGNGDLTAECLRKHVLIQGERFGDLVASLAVLAA